MLSGTSPSSYRSGWLAKPSFSVIPPSFAKLLEAFSFFPGIGKKTAQRLAMEVLSWEEERVSQLASLLLEVKKKVRQCQRCFGLAEEELCVLCQRGDREPLLCVLESPLEVLALEKTGIFRGKYHILGGTYSPSEGVGLKELHIQELRQRVQEEHIQECLIATNPNPQGETTAYFVMEYLKDLPVKITRIGRGLPVGSYIDYADAETLKWALRSRVVMEEKNSERKMREN